MLLGFVVFCFVMFYVLFYCLFFVFIYKKISGMKYAREIFILLKLITRYSQSCGRCDCVTIYWICFCCCVFVNVHDVQLFL